METYDFAVIGGGSAIRSNYISPLGLPLASLTVALHANDPAPVIIAAGQNILASGVGSRAA